MIKCAKRSTEQKMGIIEPPPIHMVSNQFLATLRYSAEISVLKQLGITGRILRNLRNEELRILYATLQDATSQVTQEKIRRTGVKT